MCHNNELLMPLTITIIFLIFLKFNPMEGLNIHQKYCNMVFSARAPNRMNCRMATLANLLCLTHDHYVLYNQHLMVVIREKCVSMHDE